MRRLIEFMLLLSLPILWSCSHTTLVSVPPRMDLARYGTLGIIEFKSNAGEAINAKATREFQEYLHAAQPGTPLIELGNGETVLASVGSTAFDRETFRKIGQKYGVDAIFMGELIYSQPETDIQITDITKLEGGARTTIRGDISSKLVEARSGASIWSSGAWATEQVGHVRVSAERGISGSVRNPDSREEMVPTLLYHLTQDFRPGTVRQRVK